MSILRRCLAAFTPLLCVTLAATASVVDQGPSPAGGAVEASAGAEAMAVSTGLAPVALDGCPAGAVPVASSPGLCAEPSADPAPEALGPDGHPHETGAAVASINPGLTKPVAIPCRGDGTSGNRIQIYYGYLAGKPNRISAVRAQLTDAVLRANAIVYQSARQTGGARHLRVVTDKSCKPTITAIKLPASAGKSFTATVEAVQKQLKATNRKYVLFLDTNVICGQGRAFVDDTAGIGNFNNGGPSYARIDAKCWNGPSTAHEIFHMLGAVQPSAPNSDGGLHCRDEWDLMCYKGAKGAKPGKSAMYTRCKDRVNDERADCGKDDYFSTNPRRGSYLATHWNTANSSFLYGGGPARPQLPSNVRNLKVASVTSGQVKLTWAASAGRVVRYEVRRDNVVIWRGTATSFTDTKPLPGKRTYWVIATNESGSSPQWLGWTVPIPAK